MVSPSLGSGTQLHQASCWRAWPKVAPMGGCRLGSRPCHFRSCPEVQEEQGQKAPPVDCRGEGIPCWQGKGSSKGFPEAPWWKPPTEEAEKKQDQEEEEDDVQLVEPLVKKSKKDDDDEDDSFETTRSKRFCVFGP